MAKSTILIAFILMVVGVICVLIALRFKTPVHPPLGGIDPQNIRPVWRMKDWFSPTGYRFHIIGWVLLGAGLLLNATYFLLD